MSTYEQKTTKNDCVVCGVCPATKAALKTLADKENMPLTRLLIEAVEDIYNCDLHTRTRETKQE